MRKSFTLVRERWGRAAWAGLVGVIFASSRCFYYARGVRFDTSPIDFFAQLLDRELLRTRLAESLLHLHSQPPIYNLLTGTVLKLTQQHTAALLWPVFLCAGLYAVLCLYFVLILAGVPASIAALVTCAIAASPAFVLYENWYFYPHLEVAWLLGAIAWLAHSRGRPGAALAVAAVHLAGLSLTRSLFHPLFFFSVLALVLALMAPGTRHRGALCLAVPSLAVLLWCAKNAVLFGFFGTSSWGSRNLSQSVVDLLGANRVAAEARLARLSPAAKLKPFEPGDTLIAAFSLKNQQTGVPALDETRKSNPSVLPINYNHWAYPPTARYYAADTHELITAFPRTYLRGVAQKSVARYLSAVDGDGFVATNRARIAKAARVGDAVDQSLAARAVLVVGLVFGLLRGISARRPERLPLVIALFAVAWGAILGIFGDYGENYRFRYEVLWLAWALATIGYAAAFGFIQAAVHAAMKEPAYAQH